MNVGGWRSCVGGELFIWMQIEGCYDILVAPKELCALAEMICIFAGCVMVLGDCGLHQLT